MDEREPYMLNEDDKTWCGSDDLKNACKMHLNALAAGSADEYTYNYIHQPKHYQLFTVEDLKSLVFNGEGIDVVAIANQAGLDKDAYMFNVLKYVLRKEKPNEPRRRDVEKIKEYCDIWLKNDDRRSK